MSDEKEDSDDRKDDDDEGIVVEGVRDDGGGGFGGVGGGGGGGDWSNLFDGVTGAPSEPEPPQDPPADENEIVVRPDPTTDDIDAYSGSYVDIAGNTITFSSDGGENDFLGTVPAPPPPPPPYPNDIALGGGFDPWGDADLFLF